MPEEQVKEHGEPSIEVVSFLIGNQSFCLDIAHVLEIRGWTETTTLPHAPDHVIGMMNLRGTVLPVIDLSVRLGLGRTKPTSRHVIIIAKIEDKCMGFLVDAVSDILTVSPSEIQPTPDVSSDRTAAYIKGVILIKDQTIRAIEAIAILPNQEFEVA